MANTAQAKKRARQAETHRQHNMALRSAMRTQIKKVIKATEAKDAETAKTAFQAASSFIDRVSQKGIIHRNAAARYKSRLSQRLRSIG